MILKITASEPVGRAILHTIAAIQAAGSTEDIQVEAELVNPRTRTSAPRVAYRAISPDTAADALTALGESSITAIVFQDVVKGTQDGTPVTERTIREARHFNTKSVQRALVHLRQAKLVISEPITTT